MIGFDPGALARATRGAAAALAVTLFGVLPAQGEKTGPTPANESPGVTAPQGNNPGGTAKAREIDPNFDVSSLFRGVCGFCHEDGGRRPGKGPQLMGSQLSDEQIFSRIKYGRPGRMAAFGGAFTDPQIWAIVAYIRSLEPH